jgi:F0F1-type ATP synthase delta subunit
MKDNFGGISDRNISVDKSLVGGFVLEKGGMRIDASYKRQLIQIFNSITNH